MENLTVLARSGDVKATATLVIKDFVDVMSKYTPGKSCRSDSFMVGDTPMAIKVYPNGFDEQQSGHVSIALRNLSQTIAVSVKCQFETDLKTWEFEHDISPRYGWTRDKFLSHAQCMEAYRDKDFVLTATVEIPGEDLKIVGNKSIEVPDKSCVCKNLYTKMENTNFNLIFEGVEVPCHKQVLAAASSVFGAMVENQHLEAIESKANIELSEEVGRAFVRFMYTGEMDKDVLKMHAVAFLELGEKYDVQNLKLLSEGEMLRQLDRKNMVEFISIGDIFKADKILEAALKLTKANLTWLRSQVYNSISIGIWVSR